MAADMKEKPQQITIRIMLVAIFVLIIMNINLNSRISNLEHGINNIQNNHIHEIRNLQWTFSSQMDSIEAQILQLSRASFDETVNIISYNSDTLSANVEIGFNLKEFGVGDEVSISARGMGGQIFNVVAEHSGAGRFFATMTLPVQDNYILTFTARGSTITSGNLMDFNIANMLCDRFRFGLDITIGSSTTHATHGNRASTVITLSPHLINATDGNNLLEIRSVFVYALSNGNVVQEWDLLPYLQTSGTAQFIEGFGSWEWDSNNEDTIDVVRLVMYDNLGIRYEQMDQVPFFNPRPHASNNNIAAPSAVIFSHNQGRVIRYGSDSWHLVHMVRMTNE